MLRFFSIYFFLDKEWTKEETDYLFDLVREYDARWYIVADRYDFLGGPPRSMEVRARKEKGMGAVGCAGL